jgi:hypothetical protein
LQKTIGPYPIVHGKVGFGIGSLEDVPELKQEKIVVLTSLLSGIIRRPHYLILIKRRPEFRFAFYVYGRSCSYIVALILCG